MDEKKFLNAELPTENEWRLKLTPEEFHVLREKGTERPFTGAFVEHKEEGEYSCKGCKTALFKSAEKYESHCGWPSFFDSSFKSKIKEIEDRSHGMNRVEVVCANCGGHLGHVFKDGPKPTGIRYCINSLSLSFTLQSMIKGKNET